jgi:exo-beta-1,3-glucanase (GH17 family)
MRSRTIRQSSPGRLFVTALFLAGWFSLTPRRVFPGSPVAPAQNPPAYKTFGLGFGPFIDGQNPDAGSVVSEGQLRERMQIIANNTEWVRSFGCSGGLEKTGLVAHGLGLKAAAGAWLSRDSAANDREVANLISEARAGHVDIAIVGSEVLLRGDLTEAQLIGYMNQVRQQIPAGIPVTTAEVYGKLLEHPSVIDNSDVVLANYYPYWEGVSVDVAVATLHRWHQQVVAAARGKSVIVSETGWPSDGNVVGNAVPSPSNASFYFLNFVSWARANSVRYFYFEALDETWKAAHEGPQGAHWGVWDKNGVLKPGMQAVFDGQTMPDNWTNPGTPGGPGTPSIEFTYVPPSGSFNNLFGQVLHVKTDDYKVAVYIFVGGWWTKPTFANPLTNITLDGAWTCDITTGGADQTATQIAAYLVPKDFSPPAMQGGQTLPSTLDQNAVAKVTVQRPGDSPYIEGQVTATNGQGLNHVTIILSGSGSATTTTVNNGLYSFINLQAGGSYTVTPSHPSYTFSPLSQTFNNLGGNATASFVAGPLPTPTPAPAGLQYYPLPAPVRIYDTRPGQPACVNAGAPLAAGSTTPLVARGPCAGIPAAASAVVGNATAVNNAPASGPGFVTLFPSGAARPVVSNINYSAGQVLSNAFTAGLGADGALNAYVHSTTDLIVDVAGYYAPPGAGGLYFHPLPQPVRLLDTRIGQSACDAPGAPIPAGGVRSELARVTCVGGVIPTDALAIVGNATVVNNEAGSGPGFLTFYPSGAVRPTVSNLNYVAGQVLSNAFTAGLGGDGRFNIYAHSTTNVIVDVTGYYSAAAVPDPNGASGLLYAPLGAPFRLLDTRSGEPACFNTGAPLGAGAVMNQQATGACGAATIPAAAQALVGNATVVNTVAGSGFGFVTLYPSGAARPLVSNINYAPGQVLSNAFVVRLGVGGKFSIFPLSTTHFITDVTGYFVPPSGP